MGLRNYFWTLYNRQQISGYQLGGGETEVEKWEAQTTG